LIRNGEKEKLQQYFWHEENSYHLRYISFKAVISILFQNFHISLYPETISLQNVFTFAGQGRPRSGRGKPDPDGGTRRPGHRCLQKVPVEAPPVPRGRCPSALADLSVQI